MSALWAGLVAVMVWASPADAGEARLEARQAPAFGTTFPYLHLRRAGHDWRKALEAADDLGLRLLRVGAYWSEIERSEGRFDFSELDEVLDLASAKGYRLVVTVGMKAPVWPEWYLPDWAAPEGKHARKNAEVSRDAALRERTLRFVRATVRHLASRRSIVAWQVENEPMDRAGETRWFIGADFVALEAREIRASDPAGRPLIVNVWSDDQRRSSFPWTDATYAARNALEIGEILGVDVYPRVASDSVSMRRSSSYPRAYRNQAAAQGADAWIIESQAEDWSPGRVGPDDVRWLVDLHRRQGYSTIFLWGFQTWYERRLKGDGELWDAVRDLAN